MIEWIGRRIDLLGDRSHPTAATHQLSWQTTNRDRVRAFVRVRTLLYRASFISFTEEVASEVMLYSQNAAMFWMLATYRAALAPYHKVVPARRTAPPTCLEDGARVGIEGLHPLGVGGEERQLVEREADCHWPLRASSSAHR